MRGERALWALGVAATAIAPLSALAWPRWGPLAVGIGLGVLGLVTICAYAWPLPLARAARRADADLGLHAAADTALHLAEAGHPAAEAVAQDALDGLQGRALPPWGLPVTLRYALGSATLSALLLALFLAWPQEAAPVADARSPAMERLEALEAEARRRGQTELVEAVRELKRRLKEAEEAAARPPEPVARRAPPEPKPPPPPEPEGPPPEEPRRFDDFSSPEAVREALEQAGARMATDEVLLAEFTAELERHLMEVTEFQDLGQDLLAQTLLAAGDDHALQNFEARSAGSHFQDMQRSTNQMNDFIEQGGGDLPDAAEISGKRDNEMDDAGHELVHALQQSYQDFLQAYAEAMRDELLEAMREAAKEESGGDNPGLGDSPDQAVAGGEKSDKSQQAKMESRSAGAQQAAQSLAEAQGQGQGRGQAEAGGSARTSKGGVGAGGGQSEDGEGRSEAGGQAGGDIERLEGQLTPGALSPEERAAMLDAMSRLAMETGGGGDFGDPWQGYFDEVERALVEEDLHPMMEGVVRAYFAGLKED